MRQRISVVLVLAGLGVLLAAPVALADAPATTLPARVLSPAILYGMVHPTNPDQDSVWLMQFGTTKRYGKTSTAKTIRSGRSPRLEVHLSSLTPGTLYHFRIVLAQGSYPVVTASYGKDLTFTTPPASYQAATTTSAGSIKSTSAIVHGIVNALGSPSWWWFLYSTSPSMKKPKNTKVTSVGAGVTAVQAILNLLRPRTTYYYELVVAQGTKPTVWGFGPVRKFTTARAPKH